MISIIVPVYNLGDVVKYCIESVLNQTLSEWELILVDDGSSDASDEIMQLYAKVDKRIKIVHKNNGGLSSARNFGLKYASGEWIMFVDGDDYLAPNTLDILSSILNEYSTEIDVIQYGYIETSEYENLQKCKSPGKIIKRQGIEDLFAALYEIGGVAASACTKLFKREIFEKLRFKEGIIHEDEEFTTRLLFNVKGILYCDFTPYYYVQREGSIINSSFSRKKLDLIHIMRERHERLMNCGHFYIANRFIRRHLVNLRVFYISAKSTKDNESAKKIIYEIRRILSNTKLEDLKMPFMERMLFTFLRFTSYALDVECIFRKITRHEIG